MSPLDNFDKKYKYLKLFVGGMYYNSNLHCFSHLLGYNVLFYSIILLLVLIILLF